MTSLEQQIRSLWGNRGDWNQGGIDRAAELARLFEANGISDVSQLGLGDVTRPRFVSRQVGGGTGQDAAFENDVEDTQFRQLLSGDRRLGFLGNVNSDNGLSKVGEQDYIGDMGLGDLLGWSSAGHGNVSYLAGTDPKTGQFYVRPQWGSSSDAGTAQDIVKGIATVLGAGYLGGAFGAEGAGGAAGAAGMSPAEQAAFLEANMGAGAPGAGWGSAAGGAGGGAGLTPWEVTDDFGLQFINAGGPEAVNPLSNVKFDLSFADPAAANFGADPFATLGANAGGAGFGGLGSNTLLGMGGMADMSPVSLGGLSGLGALEGAGVWDSIKNAIPSGLGNVVAPLLGAVAGAQGSDPQTQTNQRKLDPRLDAVMFGQNGQGGLLSRVMDFVNNNPTGMNADMTAASNNQRALLNDPRVWGGLSNVYTQSQDLLNQPVARNPFANWRP